MQDVIRRGVDVFPTPSALSPIERTRAYQAHLQTKIHIQTGEGLHVDIADMHPSMRLRPFEHQPVIVQWALRGGRRLIAAQPGLGKTTVASEIARQIHRLTGGKALIIGELNVKYQFAVIDGPRLGMDIQYVTCDQDIADATTPYLYTNYERVRDGAITPEALKQFIVVLVDEASVLADYGSKTFQTFCELFKDTQYKYCLTATPARNKWKEILHYAHFLGIADSGQALTRYFKRNSQKANELTLMESMEREFFMWVSSWGLFIEYPSDLGDFPNDRYVLPELNVNWVRLPSDHTTAWDTMDGWGQRFLLQSAANGVTAASAEKRRSMHSRISKTAEIIQAHPGEHFLLWHHLEDERKLIEQMIPGAVSVYGSQTLEQKERRLLGFARGEYPLLSTKPSIAAKGSNFQKYCWNMIFVGMNYEFEDWWQAVCRLLRFQQDHTVNVWCIFTEAEDSIVATVVKKWNQHKQLVKNTTSIIKKYGLTEEAMKAEMRRSIGVKRQAFVGNSFTAIHNDVIEEMPHIADNSIDLTCTSIPFGTQYEYTEVLNDLGYNDDNAAFWNQMDFLIPELLRVTKPGRICAIHVKDRIRFGNVTGYGVPTLEPFSDDCSYAFRKHGWLQLTRITVVNDVVRENNQTYRLTYSEMCKDGTKMGSGTPEYWLIFRKPQTDLTKAYADEPVTHSNGTLQGYRCPDCGYLVDNTELTFDDLVTCPNCNNAPEFIPVYSDPEMPLHHWQILASEFWRSSGNRLLWPEEADGYNKLLSPEELSTMEIDQVYRWYREYSRTHLYDLQKHLDMGSKLAEVGRLPKTFMVFNPDSPESHKDSVWSIHDYSRMQVLNNKQSQRRQENHVCPLPLDLIERIIERFSNPGDLVFDPFLGIGSTCYKAIEMGRRGIGTELNESYWRSAVAYCKEIEVQKSAPTLFDFLKLEAAPA